MEVTNPREVIPAGILVNAEAYGWQIDLTGDQPVLRRGGRDYVRLSVRYAFPGTGDRPWVGRPRLVSAHTPTHTFLTVGKTVEYLSRPSRARKA